MKPLNPLMDTFIRHLESKGMALDHIPSFLRNLEGALNEFSGVGQVNSRLRLLGWDGMEVDYRTMELAEACIDSGEAP